MNEESDCHSFAVSGHLLLMQSPRRIFSHRFLQARKVLHAILVVALIAPSGCVEKPDPPTMVI